MKSRKIVDLTVDYLRPYLKDKCTTAVVADASVMLSLILSKGSRSRTGAG